MYTTASFAKGSVCLGASHEDADSIPGTSTILNED